MRAIRATCCSWARKPCRRCASTDGIAGLGAGVGAAAGRRAAGRPGILERRHYYLPLTTGEIAAIDMASGKLTRLARRPRPDQSLGNLICYRGSVLSQSALVLDKFEQLDVLRAAGRNGAGRATRTMPRPCASWPSCKRADGKTAEARDAAEAGVRAGAGRSADSGDAGRGAARSAGRGLTRLSATMCRWSRS